MTKITAIIPTLNEENLIRHSLKSAEFADEVIVVDSFSTDNTINIVKQSGAKVVQRSFDDFSSQKNFAIDQASFDWIVLIDADEVLPEALQKEIRTTIDSNKDCVGFYIYRTFFFKQHELRFSGTQNDKLIRVFHKQHCRYEGKVHEKIKTDGKLGVLQHKIMHYSYSSYDQFIHKINHYAELKAEVLYEKGIIITPFHLIIKPLARFIKHYIFKLGVLDGFRGLIISFAHSYGVFVRYIKLWHLKQQHSADGK